MPNLKNKTSLSSRRARREQSTLVSARRSQCAEKSRPQKTERIKANLKALLRSKYLLIEALQNSRTKRGQQIDNKTETQGTQVTMVWGILTAWMTLSQPLHTPRIGKQMLRSKDSSRLILWNLQGCKPSLTRSNSTRATKLRPNSSLKRCRKLRKLHRMRKIRSRNNHHQMIQSIG